MKMWNCQIDDPRITEMDPVRKLWMYEMWIADQIDMAELAKNHAYLGASFVNPEGVKQAIGGNSISSTDEEFEETTKMIMEMNLKALSSEQENTEKPRKRRERRIIK
jgi:hypothetical protein